MFRMKIERIPFRQSRLGKTLHRIYDKNQKNFIGKLAGKLYTTIIQWEQFREADKLGKFLAPRLKRLDNVFENKTKSIVRFQYEKTYPDRTSDELVSEFKKVVEQKIPPLFVDDPYPNKIHYMVDGQTGNMIPIDSEKDVPVIVKRVVNRDYRPFLEKWSKMKMWRYLGIRKIGTLTRNQPDDV